MRKSRLFVNHYTALLIAFMGAMPCYAQLSAGFSANKLEGCAPLVVQFRDESTGNPTSWRWDLGNGTLSFFQNPAATYFNPGTYTIKLVVSNGTQSDSTVKVQYITVHASPTINFTASDTSGCYPLRVQFNDLSNPGDGSITNWLWDFGDGDTSSLQNPSHSYTSAGNYNVSLQVKNSKGCVFSDTRLQYIKLNNGVQADFSLGNSANCRPPTPISFTNLSTGTGSLSYQWFFGDGSSSTAVNPSHTYTSAGTYTVRLIVRNNTGCVDSLVKSNAVIIGTVDAAFSSPAILCAGQPFPLLNNSTPVPTGAQWDFGDGSFSTELSPVKTYNVAGTYQIRLISLFGACRDSMQRSIQVIDKPQSAFTAINTNACKPPLNVSFTQQAGGAISYKWLFGDGDSSAAANPSHIYRNYGSYDVTLITTNAAGCTDTLRKLNFVNIQQPSVTLMQLPQEGCVPYTYRPVITINTPDSIVSYEWNFGDGTVSAEKDPTHIYNNPGTYSISLIYTTAAGCTDSVKVQNAIRVGEKPVVNFDATPRYACAFQPINFKNNSSVGDRWFWRFGDGGTSSEKDPQYIYQDTGWFSVTLVVWNNGCADSLTIPNFIRIKPPVARFIDSSGCDTKFSRWFRDRSIGAQSWFWDFGDGNSSTLQHPSHAYNRAGSYLVTLTVKNDTCEHSTTRQVVIVAEAAAFSANDTVVCKGTAVNFSAENSIAANVSGYEWNFGDGSRGSGRNPAHIYTKTGLYSVQLVITDINGCRDTLSRPQYIRVNGPTAVFNSNTPAVCNLSTIVFSDSSFSDGTHPIKQWIWNYGDGSTDTLTAPPFQHQYITPGLFTVSLTVSDSIGCTDRVQRNSFLTISKPFPSFSSPDTLSCTNKMIRFFNQTGGNGPMTYQWTFGSQNSSTALQPVTSFTAEGDYSVKLVVTDRYGCVDSVSRINYIRIRDPKARLAVSDSVATCPPLVVNFTNQSQNFSTYRWDFGDGTSSSVSAPVHFYTYPGVYRAKLTITSVGGCVDSVIQVITVRGPQGTFRYDDRGGCEPTTVLFTGTTKDQVSFIWDFNDGTVTQTGDSIISHTYTRRGVYLPKMILKDPQGCQVSIPGKDTIRIYGVDAKFGSSQQLVCDSGLVRFRDSSVANDLITSYRWDLGAGVTSQLQHPSQYYRQSGVYPIRLIVTTQKGCVDTAALPLPLRIIESPVITMRADTGACIPATANFAGIVVKNDSSQLQWNWSFGNGTAATGQNPQPVVYTVSADYTVRLVGKHPSGCADTVFSTYRAFPLPDTRVGADQVICLNAVTDLQATGAVQYTWSPAIGLSCTDCASPKASPVQNTTYQVMGKNIYGCLARDSVLISVQQPFRIQVGSGDTLCVGETFQLFAAGADQFIWSPAAGLDNNRIARPKASPTVPTVYQVIGRDNNNCFTDTGSVAVMVYPYPKVDAGDDQTIPVGNSAKLKADLSGDVTGIRWTPQTALSCVSCSDPVGTPKQNITYSIEAVNAGGCVTKDEVSIFVFCANSNLFMPNTFSPNGDGNNDVFYPRGKGLFAIKTLRIFNRWGELVFERTNFGANDTVKGWDGTYKGKPALQDVYVYTIDVLCENNTVLTYNGNIALIR